MSDLADFLLARIADDVKVARARRDEDFRKHRIRAHQVHLAPDDAERVLRQCEAKRRIVERVVAEDDGTAPPQSLVLGDDVLAWLALPYADHPDYQEEWRA